jgi:hypothetical protein
MNEDFEDFFTSKGGQVPYQDPSVEPFQFGRESPEKKKEN